MQSVRDRVAGVYQSLDTCKQMGASPPVCSPLGISHPGT